MVPLSLLEEVDRLAHLGLFELRDYVDQRIRQKATSATKCTDSFSQVHSSLEFDRSTVSSGTLYGSGRSTPNGSSVCSDTATAADASSMYDYDLPLRQGTGHAIWPTYPAHNKRNIGQPSLWQETVRKAHDGTAFTSAPGPLPFHPGGGLKQHFCVYCREDGKDKGFGTKQDWKRHQEDYHTTGLDWVCQYKGCGKVFLEGLKFKNHLKKDHDGQALPRDCKEVKQQTRSYACGFENCRALENNWKDYCDHLSTHMKKNETEWSYDRTIRNLLKQPTISWAWKEVYANLSPSVSVIFTKLTWDPRFTRTMKHKLEYYKPGPGVKDFLQEVFWAGVPQTAPYQTEAALPPLGFLQPPPPAIASSVFPGSNSFGEALGQPGHDSSRQNTSSGGTLDEMADGVQSTSSAYRNSCVMTEAPSLLDTGTADSCFGGDSDAPHELLSAEEYFLESLPNHCNPTPPLLPSPPAHDMSSAADTKKSPKRFSRWLNGKRSQHFPQPFAYDHPDIPPHIRLPSKKSGSAYSAIPGAEMNIS